MAGKQDDQIPAGSRGPEEDNLYADDVVLDDAGEAAGETPNTSEEADKFQGKGQDDVLSSYKNLEKKLGEQSNELGELRKLNEKLTSALGGQQSVNAPAEPTNYDTLLAEVTQKVDAGEMDFGEAMLAVADITAKKTEQSVASRFQEYEGEKEAQRHYSDFLGKYNDFEQVVNTGELDEIKKANPLHDNVSAYFEYRAQKDAEAAFERGKEEALKLSQGAEQARKVLPKPGQSVRQQVGPKKPLSDHEKTQHMLEKLKATRNSS